MKIKGAEMRRNKNLGLMILFGLSVNTLSITQAGPPDDAPPTDNKVETSFRGLADATPPRLAWSATTIGEHKAWHKAFRARMLKVLGRMPDRVPLRVKWTEKQRFDTFTRHKIYIQTEKTYWCPVYYLVPHKLRKRAPAIVLSTRPRRRRSLPGGGKKVRQAAAVARS